MTSATQKQCSPGSNPHADRPNWRLAETIDEYSVNCREGLEEYSDRRAAELLGMSPVHVWRMRMIAGIPEGLVDRLLGLRPQLSVKALAQIGQVLAGEGPGADVERCPHCGGVIRIRQRVNAKAAKVINDWLSKRNTESPSGFMVESAP